MDPVTYTVSEERQMPDISHEAKVEIIGQLEKVGMEQVEVPVQLDIEGQKITVPARANTYVSLNKSEAKGIHMSRLYLALKKHLKKNILNRSTIQKLLKEFVTGQDGLSQNGFIHLKFELPLNRKALLSNQSGWRMYPVEVKASLKNGEIEYELGAQVIYSSTCPCSAALARQLIHEKFKADFNGKKKVDFEEVALWLNEEESIIATPHAQRSYATFKVRVANDRDVPSLVELIDIVEKVIATPVQTAVKRQDEQEFARLNGQNLMFCEDAARRIKNAFERDFRISDYYIHVDHRESLHPHNAVSVSVKGVENGFIA